ncbi:hypothetical protein ONS95_004195 [Cadophora gregata]|uniref:uncharacterized protein n=1 Tax=Cadophora gregata TaxID=51156 RepID=UPI0026DC21BC|nr:uncharacterized protein ONS95_004195 [Cadophora gregata]KAK0105437.1 hypothetical protein ONS96_004824 [Cadophora gregata f. sp. sojae]KAK0105668.1 hypothetical protein ONS95_004195 [Cadophora gregata]
MVCSCCNLTAPRFEPFIDPSSLQLLCPLDNEKKDFKLAVGTSREGNTMQSMLEHLPIEIYHNCLQYLDLGSIITVRRLSQTTRSAVDSLLQYKELYEHAPNILRACLKTGIAPHIPLVRLHHALTTLECHYCKTSKTPSFKFSSYLSLHTGHRTCLFCIRNNTLLKTAEFQTLVPLCCNPRTSIVMTSLPLFRTLPGAYNTPLDPGNVPPPPTTLVLSSAIKTKPGRSFSNQERKVIFGNEEIPSVAHHPLVKSINESNINPAEHYVGPDSAKQITHRYASVIAFPYVPPSRTIGDYGLFCKECVLMMRYREEQWTRKQRRRVNPIASARTIDIVTKAREMACRQYVVSDEAQAEAVKLEGDRKTMSLTEHLKTHAADTTLSPEWKAWRAAQRGPPLPLFHNDRFG